MKGIALLKEVIRYQWYDVLFDRFYSREYVSLPVNDLWQDIAKRITFSWGFCSAGGVCILLYILSLKVVKGFWMIPLALAFILLALLLSSAASVIYLYFRMRRHYKDEAHLAKMEAEGYGELHGELEADDEAEPDSPSESDVN